jgi:hypothetical protein
MTGVFMYVIGVQRLDVVCRSGKFDATPRVDDAIYVVLVVHADL